MRVLLALSLLTGCSVLFDPSRVPPSDCPASPSRCPEVANAIATCVEATCGFTCAPGFRDADGVAATGCEASCAEVPGPSRLTSISGGSPTSLRWRFPTVPEASAYRLCTGVAAGSQTCVTVPLTACVEGVCEAVTSELPSGTLVSAQVQSLNACQTASNEMAAARAVGFTFVTTNLTTWTGEGLCMPPTVATTADTLSVEQSGGCTSTGTIGDELWRDGTFDVDLRFSGQLGTEAMAGLVFSAGARRIGVTTGTAALGTVDAPTQLRESTMGQGFTALASSIATVPPDVFRRLRVVILGPLVSVSLGPVEGPLREVMRFHDDQAPGPRRLGLMTWTQGRGRAEFQRLTVTSEAVLPPRGPVSDRWTFQSDGGATSATRVLRSFGGEVRYEPCPAFAPACATCALPAAEACVRIQKVPVLGGSLSVDPPVGVDTTRPWSLRLRFAPPLDGGAPGGFLAHGASGPITEVRTAWGDGGVVETFNRPWPAGAPPLTQDRWHLLEHTFEPDAGTFSIRVDGQPVPLIAPAFPPRFPRQNKHLGAITVGGGFLNALDIWVGEISISQP
ncbi:MAG: hypothetical protein SFW67_13580 [Myxococcaceae bacterium]|nr:hypothetical protein [Myxococcaceae bacterium]